MGVLVNTACILVCYFCVSLFLIYEVIPWGFEMHRAMGMIVQSTAIFLDKSNSDQSIPSYHQVKHANWKLNNNTDECCSRYPSSMEVIDGSQFGAGKTIILSERRCTDHKSSEKSGLASKWAGGLSKSSPARTAERRRLSVPFSFRQPPTSQHRHHGERTRRTRRPVRSPHYPLIRLAVTEPPKRALERQRENTRNTHTHAETQAERKKGRAKKG